MELEISKELREKKDLIDKSIEEILNKSKKNECYICGKKGNGLTTHHIIPKYLGGLDIQTNIVNLCWACHFILHKATKSLFLKLKNGNDLFYIKRLEELRAKIYKQSDINSKVGGKNLLPK